MESDINEFIISSLNSGYLFIIAITSSTVLGGSPSGNNTGAGAGAGAGAGTGTGAGGGGGGGGGGVGGSGGGGGGGGGCCGGCLRLKGKRKFPKRDPSCLVGCGCACAGCCGGGRCGCIGM